MKQEEKDLLLKDLCARLPYGVKVLVDNKHWIDFDGRTPSKLTFDNSYRLLYVGTDLGYVKPYLFPLSSMTEEQKKEFNTQSLKLQLQVIDEEIMYEKATEFEVDFYNKHHLDWRGLIPMGLAIDATGLNIY